MDKAEALLKVKAAQDAFLAASAERDGAVLDAIRAGAKLREVSKVANVSHEAVRRIARALSVSFGLEATVYDITEHQADVLIYKLAGFDAGAFPHDVVLLNAGTDWLPAAGELARAIQRVKNGEEEGPIPLDGEREDWGFALYQVLRLSYLERGRPSDVTRVYDALWGKYGQN